MQDWVYRSQDYRRALALLKSDAASQKLNDLLRPATGGYFSELNPIFLTQVSDVTLLKVAPIWLARDGLVPLLMFFARHPRPPERWKGRLLIHFSLEGCVPSAWRTVVRPWRLKVDRKYQVNNKKILFVGLVTDYYCNLGALEKQLEFVRDRVKKKSRRLTQKPIFLVTWHHGVSQGADHYHMKYLLKICEYFGSNLDSMSWSQFMKQDSFEDYLIVDFNDYLVCSDSFIVQHALSYNGALMNVHPAQLEATFSAAEYFPLSFYHGFEIGRQISENGWGSDRLREVTGLLEYDQRLSKAFGAAGQNFLPWPDSLMQWARSHSVWGD